MSREQDRAKKKLEKNPIVECNKDSKQILFRLIFKIRRGK